MITSADLERERAGAVRDTVSRIRQIETQQGITRITLEQIKQQLLTLAVRTDLFSLLEFPPPQPGVAMTSCLYRLAEDDDHRFALYINAAGGKCDTPAHNHTTWAVIAGIQGDERNHFYNRSTSGVPKQTGSDVVKQGKGVAFRPDDLHSIHIDGSVPVINFHMYGLALEQLHQRQYYSDKDQVWRIFPAHTDIREARSGMNS
jgi:predicted metal-dependent enzyme (double-stranded beta helix superfamily)